MLLHAEVMPLQTSPSALPNVKIYPVFIPRQRATPSLPPPFLGMEKGKKGQLA